MINLVVMVVVAVVALETVLAMRELKFVKENEQRTGTEKAINYQNKDIPTIIMVCYTLPIWVVLSAIYQVIAGAISGIGVIIKNEKTVMIPMGIVPHYSYIFTEEIFSFLYKLITARTTAKEETKIKEKEIQNRLHTVVEYAKAYLNKQYNRKAILKEYRSLKTLTDKYTLKDIFILAKQNKQENKNIRNYMNLAKNKNELTKDELQKIRYYVKINRTFMYV